LFFSVEDMIKEVDVDGDGRIDFYGKERRLTILHKSKYNSRHCKLIIIQLSGPFLSIYFH
jgi:hypothetical protein